MTAISDQPTQKNFDSWKQQWPDTFDESMAQPYEAFVHEGMKGKPPSDASLEWEKFAMPNKYDGSDSVKPFDLEGKKGNWFAPASNYEDFHNRVSRHLESLKEDMAFNHPDSRVVGIRMPLDTSMGQFRDKGYSGEGPEAFIEGDIPPERLVMVPQMRTHTSGKPWPDGLGRVDQ
jgi:hypothetical protein